jgi:pimeloyl-ACP methyl ester carboxylesterase
VAQGAPAPAGYDRDVSQQWEHRRIALGWGRLSVYVAGEGPPLLLVHGLGGSGRYWAGLAPHLAASRTLIAPDLAGFGRSDKPAEEYSRGFHLDNLDGLLAGLGIATSVSVAGHSMGGVLAALFAARRPDRVDALALVAAPFPREQLHPLRLPGGPGGRAFYRFVQEVLPVLSPLVRSKTFPRAVIADYLRHTLTSYERTSHSLIWDVRVRDELEPLRAADRKELLFYSDEDRTIAADSLQLWRSVLPRAEVMVAPGGHQLLLRGGFAGLAQWFSGPAARAAA